MLTHKLEMAILLAIREAKSYKHEYVTVEHMLYGLLHDELAVQIISQCGGNVDTLKKSWENSLPATCRR